MKWYKFTKTYRGGREIRFKIFPNKRPPTDDDCEIMGESTGSGSNYGWHVKYEREDPSEDVLNKMIGEEKFKIKLLKNDLKFIPKEIELRKKIISFYKSEIEKIKKGIPL